MRGDKHHDGERESGRATEREGVVNVDAACVDGLRRRSFPQLRARALPPSPTSDADSRPLLRSRLLVFSFALDRHLAMSVSKLATAALWHGCIRACVNAAIVGTGTGTAASYPLPALAWDHLFDTPPARLKQVRCFI